LIVDAGEMRISRRESEERERRKEIETKLRLEREEKLRLAKVDLQERKSKEQAKLNELIRQANNWKESQLIREYLRALRESARVNASAFKGDEHPHETTFEYVEWGFEQADRLDPFCEPPHSVLDETVKYEAQDQIQNPDRQALADSSQLMRDPKLPIPK
jgi:hypothetical protein